MGRRVAKALPVPRSDQWTTWPGLVPALPETACGVHHQDASAPDPRPREPPASEHLDAVPAIAVLIPCDIPTNAVLILGTHGLISAAPRLRQAAAVRRVRPGHHPAIPGFATFENR